MNISDVIHLTATLRNRVRALARFGVLTLVDDSKGLQSVQVTTLPGETRPSCTHMQPYGFQSVPLEGAEAVVLALGGDLEHSIVIVADDRRYRLKNMLKGEVALYTHQGDYIWIKRDGNIAIHASSTITIDVPSVHFTGDVTIDGAIGLQGDLTVEGSGGINASNGDVFANGISLHDHRHPGVQSGGSQTGPPV